MNVLDVDINGLVLGQVVEVDRFARSRTCCAFANAIFLARFQNPSCERTYGSGS